MKRSWIMMLAFMVALLLVAALLAACSGRLATQPGGPATKTPTSMSPSAKQTIGPSKPVSPTQAVAPVSGPVTPTVSAVSTGMVSSAVTVTLEGASWKMVSYLDSKGQTTQTLTNTEVTALFQDSKVSGKDGCNQYTGNYKAMGNALTVRLSVSTTITCDAKVTAQAQAYAVALGSATTYQITGKQLQITNGAGKVAVTYAVAEAAGPVAPKAPTVSGIVTPTQVVTATAVPTVTLPLLGTNWQVASLPDAKGAASTPLTGTQITALFQGGRVTGGAGCNNYSATYVVSGAKLTINSAVATTKKTCGTSIMQQETAFLKALSGVATYQIAGDKLELRNAAGAVVMGFAGPKPAAASVATTVPATKAPAPTATITPTVKPAATIAPTAVPTKTVGLFTDTTWKWVRLVSPSAVSEVATPEKYTLVFRPDGTFSVVADCNKASGTYKTVGSRLQFQFTPSARAACASGSLSDEFIKDLGTATLYFTDEGFLYIELFADSGVMKFASAGPAK